MFNAATNKGNIVEYYLNGEQVGYNQAFLFFQNNAIAQGIPQADAWAFWILRDTEEGRETIFDLSGYQIEIIAE